MASQSKPEKQKHNITINNDSGRCNITCSCGKLRERGITQAEAQRLKHEHLSSAR